MQRSTLPGDRNINYNDLNSIALIARWSTISGDGLIFNNTLINDF